MQQRPFGLGLLETLGLEPSKLPGLRTYVEEQPVGLISAGLGAAFHARFEVQVEPSSLICFYWMARQRPTWRLMGLSNRFLASHYSDYCHYIDYFRCYCCFLLLFSLLSLLSLLLPLFSSSRASQDRNR